MAKSLHKVQKQIFKKRGGKTNSLHENSRDSQRLRRASARQDKIGKLVTAATVGNQIYVDRVAFFQAALGVSEGRFSEDELRTLTARYITRDEEEMARLKTQRRPGRPPGAREDQLHHRNETEEKEFRSGFWIPDLRDEEGAKKLRAWGGDWSSLNNLKFARIGKESGMRPSSFPPKGLS